MLPRAVPSEEPLQIRFVHATSRLYQDPAWNNIGGGAVENAGTTHQRQDSGENLPCCGNGKWNSSVGLLGVLHLGPGADSDFPADASQVPLEMGGKSHKTNQM